MAWSARMAAMRTGGVAGQAATSWRQTCRERSSIPLRRRNSVRPEQQLSMRIRLTAATSIRAAAGSTSASSAPNHRMGLQVCAGQGATQVQAQT